MSTVMVPKSSLQLVALCCIQVAAKYEETEELVPSLSKLRYLGSNIYSVDIIRKMELAVCVELKWSMGVVRPSHFIETLLALTRNDQEHEAVVLDKIEDMSYAMYHAIISDSEVSAVKPSRIALACICAARLRLQHDFFYNEPMLTNELRIAFGDDQWLITNELELFSRNILERFNSSANQQQQHEHDHQQQQQYHARDNATCNGKGEHLGHHNINSLRRLSQVSQYGHVDVGVLEEERGGYVQRDFEDEDEDMVYDDDDEEEEEELESEYEDDEEEEIDDVEEEEEEEEEEEYEYEKQRQSLPSSATQNGAELLLGKLVQMRRAKEHLHMNVEMMMGKDHLPKTLASHAASYDSIIDNISPSSPLDGQWF